MANAITSEGRPAISAATWLRYIVAVGFVGFCLFPFYMIVTTSLKSSSDIFAWPPTWLFVPTLKNYEDALFVFGGTGIITFLLNSILITALSTALAVGIGAMVAYGLTRLRVFAGRHIFFFILSTRFAPPVAFIVPLYLMVQSAGLLDTRWC